VNHGAEAEFVSSPLWRFIAKVVSKVVNPMGTCSGGIGVFGWVLTME
jgi:hypothetical protein